MADRTRSRRTLLPLTLLLGGLLGAGPFVSRTFGAGDRSAGPVFEVPGLAGWLGVALSVAVLASVVIMHRDRHVTRVAPADRDKERIDRVGAARNVDPLLAALQGPAAYAPYDLDTRLTTGTQTTADDAPMWVRRIDRQRPDRVGYGHVAEPDPAPDADPLEDVVTGS